MKLDGYNSNDLIPAIQFWAEYRDVFLKIDDLQDALFCNHIISEFTKEYLQLLESEEK